MDNYGNLHESPFGVTNGISAFQRTIDKVIQIEELKDTFTFVDNITVCGKTKEEHDQNVDAFYKVVKKYNLTLNHDKTVLFTNSIKILGYTVGNDCISPDQDRLKPLLDVTPCKSQISKENRGDVFILQQIH